jgi:hypothetical protein
LLVVDPFGPLKFLALVAVSISAAFVVKDPGSTRLTLIDPSPQLGGPAGQDRTDHFGLLGRNCIFLPILGPIVPKYVGYGYFGICTAIGDV